MIGSVIWQHFRCCGSHRIRSHADKMNWLYHSGKVLAKISKYMSKNIGDVVWMLNK